MLIINKGTYHLILKSINACNLNRLCYNNFVFCVFFMLISALFFPHSFVIWILKRFHKEL